MADHLAQIQAPVLVSHGHITTITLNRPEVSNRLDNDALDALAEILEAVAHDDAVRVVVLRGAGDAFCAGREPTHRSGGRPNAWQMRADLSKAVRVNQVLQQLPATTIAAVHGDALGFGSGLAIQCDLTIASKRAKFAFPEIDVGLPPAIVMSYLGHYVARKIALEMVLTGTALSAEECHRLGLVNHAVDPEDLDTRVHHLATAMAEKDPVIARTTKQYFAEVYDRTFGLDVNYAINLIATTLSRDGTS